MKTSVYQSEIIFASGGLRTPLDAIKSLALGAKATVTSVLKSKLENNGTVAYVESFIKHEQ